MYTIFICNITALIDFVKKIVYNLIGKGEFMAAKKPSLENTFNPLALENQICFALYVCSKEIIRRYAPVLEPLGLTYTSYITLLGLWEQDNVTVKELGKKLYLDSGTLTPLLKKMEAQGLIERTRSQQDERTVYITLTKQGHALKENCKDIPRQMTCQNLLDMNKAGELLENLHAIMSRL